MRAIPSGRKKPLVVDWKWTPSIHMPRWASRLTLEITDVRVERVQAITETGAEAEGCESDEYLERLEHFECCAPRGLDIPVIGPTMRGEFEYLWDSIYGSTKSLGFYPGDLNWSRNPWVWVIEFKVIHANVDDVLKGQT